MDDIRTRRRKKLIELIESHTSIVALAQASGMSDRYLSQIKNDTRGMGANTARKMEKALELPENWFDLNGGDTPGAAEETEHLRQFRKLTPDQQQAIVALLESMIREQTRSP